MTGIGTVRLVCQPDCARCAQVRRWLAGLGAGVEVIDVTADAAAQAELARRGLWGLPVVMTADGKAAQGASPARLAAALPLLAAAGVRGPSSPGPVTAGPGQDQARVPTICQETRISRRSGGNSHV